MSDDDFEMYLMQETLLEIGVDEENAIYITEELGLVDHAEVSKYLLDHGLAPAM